MKTPAIIMNYNRLDTLKKLSGWLRSVPDISEVYVADNNSNYPPLLDYYSDNPLQLKIHRFDKNLGHLDSARELMGIYNITDQVVVTDPDLVPHEDMPDNVMEKLHELLRKYIGFHKIGLGLEWQAIPDCYPFAEHIRRHERNLLQTLLPDGSHVSLVDTTFALYRAPISFGNWKAPAIRTSRPYTMYHPDWHIDPHNLSDEYKWYLNHCSKSASYATMLKSWLDNNRIDWRLH